MKRYQIRQVASVGFAIYDTENRRRISPIVVRANELDILVKLLNR